MASKSNFSLTSTDIDDSYQLFAKALFDQWQRRETWCCLSAGDALRREKWCAAVGPIPDRQRRHYPQDNRHQIRLCPLYSSKPFTYYDRSRPVYFPPPRKCFPHLKNRSHLEGYF